MTDVLHMALTIAAEVDVVPAVSAECVTVHPSEPCPGFPHREESA